MSLGEEDLGVLTKILVENIGEGSKKHIIHVKGQVAQGKFCPQAWWEMFNIWLKLKWLSIVPVTVTMKIYSEVKSWLQLWVLVFPAIIFHVLSLLIMCREQLQTYFCSVIILREGSTCCAAGGGNRIGRRSGHYQRISDWKRHQFSHRIWNQWGADYVEIRIVSVELFSGEISASVLWSGYCWLIHCPPADNLSISFCFWFLFKVLLTLKKPKEQGESPFLVLQVSHLGIDTRVRKFEMCATTYIKEITMKCLEFKGLSLLQTGFLWYNVKLSAMHCGCVTRTYNIKMWQYVSLKWKAALRGEGPSKPVFMTCGDWKVY